MRKFKIRIVKDNSYLNNVAAIVGTVMVGLITILSNYVKRLGGNDLQLTLVTALPALVAFLVLLPGAYFVDKAKDKIKLAVAVALTSRIFLFLFALVPLLPDEWQVWTLIVLVGLRNAPESVWGVAYQSIVSEVFSVNDLAGVMGIRNRLANITQLITVVILSQVMNHLNRIDYDMVTALQLVFAVSAIFGIWEISYYRKLKAGRLSPRIKAGLIDSLKQVISDLPKQQRFINYALTVLPFYIVWTFPSALFNIYCFTIFDANESWMIYITVVSSIFAVVTLPVWKKLIEKHGYAQSLSLAIGGMSLVPLFYALSPNLLVLTILHFISGTANAGVTLLFFNLLIEMTPNKQKTIYMAIFTSLVNLITFIMPLLCATLIEPLGLKGLMLVSFGGRVVVGIWVVLRQEKLYQKKNAK